MQRSVRAANEDLHRGPSWHRVSREWFDRVRQVPTPRRGSRVCRGDSVKTTPVTTCVKFRTLYSLEVVEHVCPPRSHAATVADLLLPLGHAVISTPDHGYLKNVTMAIAGKINHHPRALWDHEHIKFCLIGMLTSLLVRAGLVWIEVRRVGRIPSLTESVIFVFRNFA